MLLADKNWSEKLGMKEIDISALNSEAMKMQKETSDYILRIFVAFTVISILSMIVAMINRYMRNQFNQIETSKNHLATSQNYEKTTNEAIRDLKEKHDKALDDLKLDKRNLKSQIKI